MDYDYIEALVVKAKNGDTIAKEKLIAEFKPYILNISKRTFIYGYELQDIQSECYHIFFKCLAMYNVDTHRFVAYATNGIKNSISYLIEKNKNRSSAEGIEAFSLYDEVKDKLLSEETTMEDVICDNAEYEVLNNVLNKLNEDEKDLINFVFFKENTTKNYAKAKNMCYSTALLKRKTILNKICNDFKISF